MTPEDLLEMLMSIVEEDAIIARLYRLFYIIRGYPLDVIKSIVLTGMEEHYFDVETIDGQAVNYRDIIWEEDNNQQELIVSSDKLSSLLFTSPPMIPAEFQTFLK